MKSEKDEWKEISILFNKVKQEFKDLGKVNVEAKKLAEAKAIAFAEFNPAVHTIVTKKQLEMTEQIEEIHSILYGNFLTEMKSNIDFIKSKYIITSIDKSIPKSSDEKAMEIKAKLLRNMRRPQK